MNKKQFIFSNLFIIIVFTVLYFIYPEYKLKTDLEGMKYRAKQYTAQLENYTRDALQKNNIDHFYDTYLSIINSANIKYIIIFDNNNDKLFQFNGAYQKALDFDIETELNPVVKDSTIHVRTSIFNQNDSLMADLSVGFDIYHIYQDVATFRIIAVGVSVLLFILVFLLIFYFAQKTTSMALSSLFNERKNAKNNKNEMGISPKLANELELLSKNLTLLINEINLKNKNNPNSNNGKEITTQSLKLESQFTTRLYKVFNNYRKVSDISEILNIVCRDVCEEFLYDISILITLENDALVLYESYVRGMPTFQEKFNKKCKKSYCWRIC